MARHSGHGCGEQEGAGSAVSHTPAATASAAPTPEAAPVPAGDPSLPAITAPMLGIFHRAPGPGEDPFVEVGSDVGADTIVCIIEVMKMMDSVPAGVAGTIAEVLPDNAALVEYGQPLFRVTPA